MLQVTYGTMKFWDTNTLSDTVFLPVSVLTSVYTFSGKLPLILLLAQGVPRVQGRKEENKNIHTFPYNISQNLIGYGVFTLTHSCKALN